MSKKKITIWAIIVIIIIALIILFTGRVASKPADTASTTPSTSGIPDNMSISNELGG